jgi:hypothetical protein
MTPKPDEPRAGLDQQRIDLSKDWDVDYWTTTLGVTREELIAAIGKVGDRVKDVADHLARQSAAGPTS